MPPLESRLPRFSEREWPFGQLWRY